MMHHIHNVRTDSSNKHYFPTLALTHQINNVMFWREKKKVVKILGQTFLSPNNVAYRETFWLLSLSFVSPNILSFVFWLLSLQTLHIVKTFPIFNHSHYNPLSWHGVPILLAKTCFLRPIILWSWSERGMLKIMIHTKECLDWVAPCVFLHSEGPKPTHASTQLIQNRKKMLMRYFFLSKGWNPNKNLPCCLFSVKEPLRLHIPSFDAVF